MTVDCGAALSPMRGTVDAGRYIGPLTSALPQKPSFRSKTKLDIDRLSA